MLCRRFKLTLMSILCMQAFSNVSAAEKLSISPVDNDTLAEVQRLYQITEDEAITRLAAEAEASDLFRRVTSMELAGYAGAWFDPQTMKLNVALADAQDVKLADQMGAKVVRVSWAMKELETVMEEVVTKAEARTLASIRELYIDPVLNRVVVGVAEQDIGITRDAMWAYRDRLFVVGAGVSPDFSADIRGADGIVNKSLGPEPYPCSVGVSTSNGFFTAGHCVDPTNEIFVPGSDLKIGDAAASAYNYLQPFRDISWVRVIPGWTPKSKINGYSQGLMSVPAKWSGVNTSPINSTVCRYGQTSGGPHCGSVSQTGVLISMSGGEHVKDATKVQGSCSNDGDSGGTWLSAGDYQIQGTNIGGEPTGTCPGSASWTYFQPITHHVGAYNNAAGSVLTAHGAAKATVSGYLCPDLTQSGGGAYVCRISYFNSQGKTSVNWNSSTTVSWFTDDMISGRCNTGTVVTVNLAINNPYGTYTRAKSFACPTGPMP